MGYNAGGTYFENHRSSGFDTVANDVSCVVELRRSKRQAGGMMPNTDSMEIDIDEILMETTAACRRHYTLDTQVIPTNGFPNRVLPCPSNLNQARNDPRFIRDEQFRATAICYLQRYPVSGNTILENLNTMYGQQCCYDRTG